MIRSWKNIWLLLAISLAVGAIWPDFSRAVQAPQLELLGEIKADLRVPTRIDVDKEGNLYVADSRLQQIYKFDKFGKEQLTIKQEKISGAGLAVTSAGDRIYASAFDKVIVFDAAGQVLGYLGQGPGEFSAAASIVLTRDGLILVADVGSGVLKRYHADGSYAGQFGSIRFVANSSLAIHPLKDEVYVSDCAFHRGTGLEPTLSVYGGSAQLLRSFLAESGFGTEPLLFFGGMAFDSLDRFYITDMEGKSIRILDGAGNWLASYDRGGAFTRSGSMVFDPSTNRLFVVQADHRVDVYGIDGAQNPVAVNHPPAVPVPASPIGGSEVSSALPKMVFNNAVDPDEGDSLSYNVRVFDAAGNQVTAMTVAEQAPMSSAAVDVALAENGLYRWQVQAHDGEAESDWSELQSFYVNAVQEAPSVPELFSPLAGEAVRTESVFQWFSASDADPFDTVSYLFEVAADESFTTLLYSEDLNATERALADWSEQIEPGNLYFWRITAVDNHGLSSSSTADARFLYQATYLHVTANMPDARVYLAGNHGYAGQFVGAAPVKLRDLPEGRYQLVVERAGFEPLYQPIDLLLEAPTEVFAELRPAYQIDKLSFQPLRVNGSQVKLGAVVTPQIADLDLDGVVDLLLTHADGSIHYHPGVVNNTKDLAKGKTTARSISFQAETLLSFPQVAGGTPCFVDWNNDYRQDLIIGSADGAVWLFLNQGNLSFSAEPELLAAVAGAAVPAVGDIDADGDKDLLVGGSDGELVLFENVVNDAQPQLAEPQLLVTLAEAAAPVFADWDGDGLRELLIGAEGELYHAVYSAGALTSLSIVEAKGKPIARIFALDLDGIAGKDIVGGTADGQLRIAYSDGTEYVVQFYPALEAKLQQLQTAVAEEAADLVPLLYPMFFSVAQQDLATLASQLEQYKAKLPEDSASIACANELANILLY